MYTLGIDLGTTFAAAAVYHDGATTAIQLEDGQYTSPSVLARTPNGDWVVGLAAAQSDHPKATRFKRELCSEAPALVGSTPIAHQELMAIQFHWVLRRVRDRMGSDPVGIALTHPSIWGANRQRALTELSASIEPALLSEPLAAANFYASQNAVPDGRHFVVYDFGGGTTDIAVLLKDADNFVVVGHSGTNRGSTDLDDTIYDHLEERFEQSPGGAPGAATNRSFEDDPLLELAVNVKQQLSTRTRFSLMRDTNDASSAIEIDSEKVASLLGPAITEGVDNLQRALERARLQPRDVHAILLAGGGCNLQLVKSEIVSRFDIRTESPEYPKLGVAFGAAIASAAATKILSDSEPQPPEGIPDLEPRSGEPGSSPMTPIRVDTSGLRESHLAMTLDAPTGPDGFFVQAIPDPLRDDQRLVSIGSTTTDGAERTVRPILVLLVILIVVGLIIVLV